MRCGERQKISYLTRSTAESAAERTEAAERDRRKRRVTLRTYLCADCRMWHLTSQA